MKKFFLVILVLLFPLTLFFTGELFIKISNYQRLKIKVPITVSEWRVDEKSKDKFKVVANYQYQFSEKLFQNKASFKRKFMSSDAAVLYLKQQADKDLFVWIDPLDPKKSSLERIFPIRQMINATLAIAIFIYFLVFRYYLHERFPE